MNADEVKTRPAKSGEGLQSLIGLARRSLPDLRRGIETLEPVRERGALALLRRTRERIDWTRVPGLRPRPREKLQVWLAKQIGFWVLLPTAVVGLYLFVFAADQYVAQAKFAVRGDVEPMGTAPGNEYAGLISKHNSQDSYIVRDYVASRAMAEAAEAELKVSELFSRGEADFLTRYSPPQPAEKFVRYWNRHVTTHIELVSGVITLSVKAFTPQDALAISRFVVARAEGLVNEISRRAQADMIAHTEKDAQAAQERLRKARLALQTFRNTWGIIDPVKAAEQTMTTILALRKDKMKAENDLQVLRDSRLDERTRSIQVLLATIAATDAQIKRLQDQLTTDGLAAGAANNITQALLEFEGLKIEQTIAEKLNESFLIMLDRTRIAASRQQIYLSTFVPPQLPVLSLYPERGHTVIVTLFFCFALWSASTLLISGVKDRRI